MNADGTLETDAEKDKWLEESFPRVYEWAYMAAKLVDYSDKSQSEKDMAHTVFGQCRTIQYLLDKRRDLQVENQNIKDILAAIDRRN